MPTSFFIFLVASFIALIPAWFDHGETWEEIKTGDKNKKFQNGIKLLALWIIPILTIIGTVYLGIESVISDKQDKETKRDLASAHKEIFSLSNQVQQVSTEYNEATNALARAIKATEPKTLQERLIDCFNSIDPLIVKTLAERHQTVDFNLTMSESHFEQLEHLATEEGANKFISKVTWLSTGFGNGGTSETASLSVFPSLLQ